MTSDADQYSPWEEAALAATFFAIDPFTGVNLRAGAGPARDIWLANMRDLSPPHMPFLRMPAAIGDERLLGGLDLTATLRSGKPVAQTGLLAQADGGVLVLAMAERLEASSAARIAAAMDHGCVCIERDGVGQAIATRFGVIALDEGHGDDEAPPPALMDRLAFHLDLAGVSHREAYGFPFDAEEIAAAQVRLPNVRTPDSVIETLVSVALHLGVISFRAPLFALRVARAAAALRGADGIADQDIAMAARLVLAPRATLLPQVSAPPEPQADAGPDDSGGDADEQDGAQRDSDDEQQDEAAAELSAQDLQDVVLAAAAAAIPPGLLARIQNGLSRSARSARAGKAGASAAVARRGRPLGARQGQLRHGRLSLVDTLRAAAPWQPIRRRAKADDHGKRIIVEPDDFRIVRLRARTESVAIFVVDASGSSAMQRLAEVKGAIELLLADCYVRRESVALIAFRGKNAEIILPPTRSLTRARRMLAGLPGGGGTPIAAALDAGLALADSIRRRGQSPFLVLMTDGRANIARDGSPGRAQALEDALAAARRVRAAGVSGLAIDTSPMFQPLAEPPTMRIGQAMAAQYIRLPQASAAGVSQAVRAASGG
jgi:magnesium chelatase subunit D